MCQANASVSSMSASSSRSRRVLEIVSVFAVGIGAVVIGGVAFGQGIVSRVACVWAANLLMLAMCYAGLRARGQGWSHFGLRSPTLSLRWVSRTFFQSLLVFLFAAVSFVLGAVLIAMVVGIPQPADMSKYDYLNGNLPMTLLALLSVYVVSSFAEEVIYRGFLMTRLQEVVGGGRRSDLIAIVISSLVFGAVHSDWGVTGMVQASCMGIALAISFIAVRRNLWVTILAHAYLDTLLIVQMYYGAG